MGIPAPATVKSGGGGLGHLILAERNGLTLRIECCHYVICVQPSVANPTPCIKQLYTYNPDKSRHALALVQKTVLRLSLIICNGNSLKGQAHRVPAT